jgi:hypothetical protein|uniref:Uncharacterized protein n=1 Tax=viral metagenome TaxID=1070528 RepID=A0A6C0LC98_9ZZZZ
MKAIAIFLLFIGSIMIIQGYYNNKSVCKKDKVVVKYIPRSIYEEQLKPAESLQTFYRGMFEDILLH